MRFLATLCVLALAADSSSQTSVVSPAHFTAAEANVDNSYPFGFGTTFRYAQIHDDLAGTPRLIKGLSFRRDGTQTVVTLYLPYSVTLDLWCSTATTTAATPSTSFDQNHGADKSRVITARNFNFPQTDHSFVPNPFVYDVPFDIPFIFVGARSLCWEVHKTAATNSAAYFLDAASGAQGHANPPLAISRFGAGCRLSATNAPMSADSSAVMSWPSGSGNLTVTGTAGPLSGFVIVVLGLRETTAFGGSIPLPFLIPGSGGAPSGPCHLYTDVLLVTASVTTATGASTTPVPVPATPDLNGLRTFAQIWAFDAAANPLGVVTSNAVNHNFVAPYPTIPVARIYLPGNLGAVGTAAAHIGLITRVNS